MPVPFVVAAIPSIIIWSRNALAAGGLVALVSETSVAELWDRLKVLIVAEVARVSGLQLDPDDPFTDASMAGAVGQKISVPLRSLKNMAMIREDLDGYATELISSKSGYTVRSVQNVAMLKEDFLRIGAAELSARLGLPAGVMPSPGAVFDAGDVRAQLLLWAKAELMAEVSSEASIKAADILGAVDLEATAAGLNARFDAKGLIDYVSAKQIAVRIASEMATDAIVEFQRFAINGSKKSRRRELLRAAQAKFRAAHGNRQKYVPLGMSAVIG